MRQQPPPASSALRSHAIEVTGGLKPYVSALIAVELSATGPLPFAIAPHESLMLSVQMGADSEVEAKGPLGSNTALTGIRQWTGAFVGAGDCITLFALLTPLGFVHLLESQPVDGLPRIRAPLASLVDGGVARGLESDVALAKTLEHKLHALGAWLEGRATANRALCTAAVRAARAAMRICREPRVAIDTLAGEQHVSRRQLERDFGRWIGTSPRHLSQVACVQALSRKAQRGASLADIAADLGFTDQAHMSRVVRQLTGLTPRSFVRSSLSPLAATWRQATAGGTVYL